LKHQRLLKQILTVCQSATEYLTADELSAMCAGDHPAKRIVRYLLMLQGEGYVVDTRKRILSNRAAVNEYRLIGEKES
jgi:hypothetical protein